jgi:hypothetical protein
MKEQRYPPPILAAFQADDLVKRGTEQEIHLARQK